MGRRDAVQFTLECVAEWRRLGALVTFEPGWETRGNGTSADYEGCNVHHTATPSSPSRPFPTRNMLVNGRSDLPGPLCNVAEPVGENDRPHLHVIAAHPANHAGASGGPGTAPMPVTRLFNPRSFGDEIDYGGNVPMTPGQRKAALIFGRGVTTVLRRSTDYIRAHAETSVTGKWDPGYAPGKTIDMATFRRDAANLTAAQEDDMPYRDWPQADKDALLTDLTNRVWSTVPKDPSGKVDFGPAHAIHRVGWLDLNVNRLVVGISQLLAREGQDASAVAAALRPIILDAVEQGMAADNNGTAEQIVDQIAAKLAAPTP
jgi:hypothetical protein